MQPVAVSSADEALSLLDEDDNFDIGKIGQDFLIIILSWSECFYKISSDIKQKIERTRIV